MMNQDEEHLRLLSLFHLYSLIVAGLCCFFVPLGTILGVLTIIVLLRPTVKERFQNAGQVT